MFKSCSREVTPLFTVCGASVMLVTLGLVLVPAFAGAGDGLPKTGEKVRQRTCLSNEQQIGQALRMYVEDNDGFYPVQFDHTAPGDAQKASDTIRPHDADGNKLDPDYYDALMPYLKNGGFWICPDDKGERKAAWMGYHMNGNVITAGGLAAVSVVEPSRLVVLRDSGGGTTQVCFLRSQRAPYYNGCDDGYGPKSVGPHSGGYNLLFADGHARLFQPLEAAKTVAQRPGDGEASCL